MADRKGLAIIGLILGGVTLATVTVAGAIVQRHLDGRLSFHDTSIDASQGPSTTRRPLRASAHVGFWGNSGHAWMLRASRILTPKPTFV
jgi:hypothetical protein